MHGLNSKAYVASQPARGLTRRLILRCSPQPPGSSRLSSLLTSLLVSRARLAALPSVLLMPFIAAKFLAGYELTGIDTKVTSRCPAEPARGYRRVYRILYRNDPEPEYVAGLYAGRLRALSLATLAPV